MNAGAGTRLCGADLLGDGGAECDDNEEQQELLHGRSSLGAGVRAERSALARVTSGRAESVSTPRDVVVVLLDSLNRHLLGCYGGAEFDTPNLDRLAARSVRFTNHRTGSLPCMPARHDLLVGALDFPWRPWGSIEVWEDAVTHLLRRDAGHLDDARIRPSAPVRGRRRELPPRLRRLGLRARPRRRPVAHPARPVVDRRAGAARAVRAVRSRLRPEPHVVPRRGRLSRTEDDDRGGALARSGARLRHARRRSARSCSSTSSIRTNRSTHPNRGRLATTPSGKDRDSSGRRTRVIVKTRG